MLRGTHAVVMVKVAVVTLAAESATLAPKVLLPAEVEMPLITPAELRDKPSGSAPEVIDHVYGGTPPAADKVAL